MGTIQIDGSTPKLTIGNATAEDALIVFDGNAQDFYIGLDVWVSYIDTISS